ncbi:hypothetical protein FA15DRAFT_669298 [Coprinopsis marcescibilis]|uniref:Uncharacterized protein n=1 Tax=Coprinopsis marcescibilis TaxID=230819 RepID=A0A5C3KWL4_COPMA|nr:hypothetical protein FA15DRAFT_669298 [Coprinopsis marcescibilis]
MHKTAPNSLSQINYPSISLVLSMPAGGAMVQDMEVVRHRQVHFDILLKPDSSSAASSSSEDGELMRTVDTRYEGSLAFKVLYDTDLYVEEDNVEFNGESALLYDSYDGHSANAPTSQSTGKLTKKLFRTVACRLRRVSRGSLPSLNQP